MASFYCNKSVQRTCYTRNMASYLPDDYGDEVTVITLELPTESGFVVSPAIVWVTD